MDSDLKRTLWAAADKLRSSMDAAEYKHIVLGLIFLKYISDAFDQQRTALQAKFADPASDLYLDDPADRQEAAEERDYYTMDNVFWVPEQARWEVIRASAKQADIGTRIDGALEAIETENPRRGCCGIKQEDLVRPENGAESVRAAKYWLETNMTGSRRYAETVDQERLTARMDLGSAYQQCRSFRKLWRDMADLVTRLGGAPVPIL